MVTINCCKCQDGVTMDTDIHGACFNCNHYFCEYCPRSGDTKPSYALALDQPLSVFKSISDFSLPNTSASSTNHGSHGSYHMGYHNSHHYHK